MERSESLLRKFINSDRNVDSMDLVTLLAVFCLAKHLKISLSNQFNGKNFSDLFEFFAEHIEDQNQVVLQKALEVLSPSLNRKYDSKLINLISDYFESNNEINCKETIDALFLEYERTIGKNRGVAIDPTEVTKIALKLCNTNITDYVFDPFAGLASFITQGNFQNFCTQEIASDIWALSVIRLLVFDLNPVKSVNVNTIENWNFFSQKFDLIITIPPFGLKIDQKTAKIKNIQNNSIKTVEEYVINYGLSDLKLNGKLAIVLPSKFLNEKGNNSILRERLIKEDLIEYIVLLPSNIFFNTSISTCLVVLNKNKQNKNSVTLINGSTINSTIDGVNKLNFERISEIIDSQNSMYLKLVENNFIQNNSFDFSFHLYFPTIPEQEIPEGFQIISVKDILSSIKKELVDKTVHGRLVKIANLSNDTLLYEINNTQIEPIEITSRCYKLVKPAILVSRRFNRLKPSYCIASSENPIYIIPEIEAFELINSNVYLPYLIKELNSEFVQKQIELMASGFMPIIKREDFLKIQILLPNLEKQKEIIDEIKLDKIRSLGIEFDEWKNALKNDYEKSVRFRKHAIGQEVFELKNSFSSLMKFKNLNNGILKDDMIINPNNNTNIKQFFQTISGNIEKVSEMVYNIAEDFSYGFAEDINIIEFLEEYCTKNNGLNFKMELIHTFSIAEEDIYIPDIEMYYKEDHSKVFKHNGVILIAKKGDIIEQPKIRISKESLEQILANVKNNIIKHGFTSKNRKDYKIIIHVSPEEENVKISISNNGNPIKEGMTQDSFFINERHGNIEIKKRVEHFSGDVVMKADPNAEFPVKIILTFKNQSIITTL